MLRLIVMRHAKSDWDAGAQTDHERPLNDRGRKEAPMVGRRLADEGFVPDFVLSSDSTRTKETYERMRSSFPEAAVRFVRELYHAGLDDVRALIGCVPEDAKTILLLGHNPGWEEMASTLAGEPVEMKTAYAAVFESTALTFPLAFTPGLKMRLVTVIAPK